MFRRRTMLFMLAAAAALIAWYLLAPSVSLKDAGDAASGSMQDPPSSPSVAPVAGGAFAFTTRSGSGVSVRFPDGSDWQAFAKALSDRHLAWSPDGVYVAFRAESDPPEVPRRSALFVAKPSERVLEQITDYLPGLTRPGWRRAGREMELFVSGPQGLVTRRFPMSGPEAVDPFLVYEWEGDIWVRSDSGLPTQLSRGGGYAPQLSPDRRSVLYQWRDGIYLAAIEDSPALERFPIATGISPVWSPSGDAIAYIVQEDNGHDFLFSDIYRLEVTRPGASPERVSWSPEEIETELAWSQDNVLYFTVRDDAKIRRATWR